MMQIRSWQFRLIRIKVFNKLKPIYIMNLMNNVKRALMRLFKTVLKIFESTVTSLRGILDFSIRLLKKNAPTMFLIFKNVFFHRFVMAFDIGSLLYQSMNICIQNCLNKLTLLLSECRRPLDSRGVSWIKKGFYDPDLSFYSFGFLMQVSLAVVFLDYFFQNREFFTLAFPHTKVGVYIQDNVEVTLLIGSILLCILPGLLKSKVLNIFLS